MQANAARNANRASCFKVPKPVQPSSVLCKVRYTRVTRGVTPFFYDTAVGVACLTVRFFPTPLSAMLALWGAPNISTRVLESHL